jgi:hypothetical protein
LKKFSDDFKLIPDAASNGQQQGDINHKAGGISPQPSEIRDSVPPGLHKVQHVQQDQTLNKNSPPLDQHKQNSPQENKVE